MRDDKLLTVREVAQQLQTTEATVTRWLRDGKLRGVRPGGTKLGWRVPESELRKFLGLD